MSTAENTDKLTADDLRAWLTATGWTAAGKGALSAPSTWTTTRPGLCWHRTDGPRHYKVTLDRGGMMVEQRATAGAWAPVVYARWGAVWRVPHGVQMGGRCVIAASEELGRSLHGLE